MHLVQRDLAHLGLVDRSRPAFGRERSPKWPAKIQPRQPALTAAFHVCSTCGIVPLATSEIANRLHAVVNVNALENVDPSRLQRTSASFEGEELQSRLARRERNWIADVRFAEGGDGD
jgi:hypothetical protein